jgi:hypothetical protein
MGLGALRNTSGVGLPGSTRMTTPPMMPAWFAIAEP